MQRKCRKADVKILKRFFFVFKDSLHWQFMWQRLLAGINIKLYHHHIISDRMNRRNVTAQPHLSDFSFKYRIWVRYKSFSLSSGPFLSALVAELSFFLPSSCLSPLLFPFFFGIVQEKLCLSLVRLKITVARQCCLQWQLKKFAFSQYYERRARRQNMFWPVLLMV